MFRLKTDTFVYKLYINNKKLENDAWCIIPMSNLINGLNKKFFNFFSNLYYILI
jgi:hypothetical protein